MSDELEEMVKKINEGNSNTGINSTLATTETTPVVNPPEPTAQQPQETYSDDFWKNYQTIDLNQQLPPVAQTTPAYNPPATPGNISTPAPVQTPAPAQAAPAIGAPQGRLSSKAIKTSAAVTVSTINLCQLAVLRPLMNWRFKKETEKRYGANAPILQQMVMSGQKPTDAAEKKQYTSFMAFLNQRDQKIEDLPFSETEEKDMQYAFENYFEATQKTMSPEVLLYTSLISIIGKRAIDVAMWD